MKAVNLLPDDHITTKRPSRVSRLLPNPLYLGSGAVMVAATAGLGFAAWSATSTVTSKQHQLSALNAQIASLPAPPNTPSGPASAEPGRIAAVTSLVNDRMPWDHFLDTLSRVMPEDSWLSTLVASSPGAAATLAAAAPPTATGAPAPAAGSSTFTITGFTYSEPSVARVLRRLALVPWLTGLNLVTTSQTTLNTTTLYQFTIGATVVPTTTSTGSGT